MDAKQFIGPRQEQLLALLGSGNAAELDPVRIMKGLFVFTKEAPELWVPAEHRYEFVAYDYGPCSFEVYRDLDRLEAAGYVVSSETPWRSWKTYRLSDKGREFLRGVSVGAEAREYLRRIHDFVTSLSFDRLLRVIYQKYPDFAVNSVFNR